MRILLAIIVAVLLTSIEYDFEYKENVSNTSKQYAQDFNSKIESTITSTYQITDSLVALFETKDWKKQKNESLHAELKSHAEKLIAIRAILLITPSGEQHAISYTTPPNIVRVTDREYFQKLKDGHTEWWYGPYIGRNTGRASFALAKPLKRDGKFDGLVLTVLGVEHLTEMCTSSSDVSSLILVKDTKQVITACGVDNSLLQNASITLEELLPDTGIQLVSPGIHKSDTRISAVYNVASNPEFFSIASTSLRRNYVNFYKHLMYDLLIIAVVIGILVFPKKWITKT